MAKFNYFLPFIFTVVIFSSVEWYLAHPKMFFILLIIVVILNFLVAYLFNKQKQNDWWRFALLPVLANILVFSYLVILTSSSLIQILIVLLTIFNYIYWHYVFYYLYRQNQYTAFSLENFSFYINFILVFLLGSLAYGLRSLLSLNILLLSGIVLIVLVLIVLQIFWISKFSWRNNKIYLSIIILVLMELFFMLSFLPLDYNLLGFIWATGYYLVISMVNDKLKDRLTKIKVKYILVLVFISWLILFLSARWI